MVIDAMSMQYLNEAEIDYESSLLGAEFKIRNPNVKATCGYRDWEKIGRAHV